MTNHKLKIRRIHDDAIIPQYATAGAACFDLYACTVDGYKLTGAIPQY